MQDPKIEKETVELGEQWSPIETKLVLGSLAAGVITLIVLATLVHIFILGN